MRLASFEVSTAFGPVRRIGAVLGAELDAATRIVDLNAGIGSMALTAMREKRELSYVRDGLKGLLEAPEAARD